MTRLIGAVESTCKSTSVDQVKPTDSVLEPCVSAPCDKDYSTSDQGQDLTGLDFLIDESDDPIFDENEEVILYE